jgi:hypothetical protein
MHRASVLTLLALLVAPQLLAWTPPERVDRRPDNYVVYMCAIAAGRDGTPHVAWSECKRETGYEKTMYAKRQGDTWTIPINVGRDSGDLRAVATVVDSSGSPFIVWSEEAAQRIRYVRQIDDTWSVPKLAFPNRGIEPRLAIDSHDRVHLIYEELTGRGGILYSYYNSNSDSWVTPMLVAADSQPLGWSSLAADRRDHLHAVWMSWGTKGLGYSTFDGSQWQPPVALPDPSPGTFSGAPRVAADTSCRPHVVWEEGPIYYSSLGGDSWMRPEQVSQQVGGRPLIGIDDLNRVNAVWGWDYGLRHSVRTDTGWSVPESINGSTSLADGLASSPAWLHLAWSDAHWDLYYSRQPLSGAVAEGTLAAGPPRLSLVVRLAQGALGLDYSMSHDARVTIALYDVAGRRVARMDLGRQAAGVHFVCLAAGTFPDSGAYVVRLQAGNLAKTTKIVLVK